MKEINREKKKTNGKYYMVRSVLWEAKTDRFTYLVFKNGIIIPAAVATNNSTTCNTVKTTFINLTTSARALELSMPSTVTYCCWDRCSILVICWDNRKQNIRINESRLMDDRYQKPTLVWQFSRTSCTSRSRSSLWYWTFSSVSASACFRFSISF